jgi:DNA polymerase-3 subunit beta
MKIICQKSDLQKSVNISLRAVPVRSTMPILECILIDASTNTIRMISNDTDMGIETILHGDVVDKGVIAINAKMFAEVVRKLPDSEVTIETDYNMNVVFLCDKSRVMIPGEAGDDFTYLPNVERDECVEISQFTLRQIISQTIFSIASNENNKLMTGELFEITGDMLRVVALDGHRIAIRNLEISSECSPKRVVVPGKTLNEISKILSGEADDLVTIYFSDNYLLFEFNDTVVLSRLIDGEYFKIDQMLSSDYETKIEVNRQEFISCIDRATLLVRESDKMPVIIDITDEQMELQIDSAIGSMDEEIDIEKTGKDITIGFNPKFLLDALRVIEDERVSIFFVNAKAPCFIRDEEGNYIYLILPVNINVNR